MKLVAFKPMQTIIEKRTVWSRHMPDNLAEGFHGVNGLDVALYLSNFGGHGGFEHSAHIGMIWLIHRF
jgi:nicotinamide mononucleotide (NMN) deamidase PncC